MENKVLATVEGNKITQADVNSFIQRLGPQQAMQFQNEEGQKRILQELINQNLFLADAKANNLSETEMFKIELDKMKDIILTQMNINSLLNDIAVDEEEVKAYFKANEAKYAAPEKANTSHILVDSEEEIKDIRAKVVAGDISFEDAAKAHSKCPSKEKGGNLGAFPKGQMVPEFEAVAFEMKKDEISEPVKTQFGYHIIKLIDKEEAGTAKYEDVADKVKKELLAQKQHAKYSSKVNDLREKFTVEMA